MKNSLNNQNLFLKEQLPGTNISQKYQQKEKKQYLDCLIDPSFQEVNRLFVLSFEDEA